MRVVRVTLAPYPWRARLHSLLAFAIISAKVLFGHTTTFTITVRDVTYEEDLQ